MSRNLRDKVPPDTVLARRTIHMKCQALFSLKKKSKYLLQLWLALKGLKRLHYYFVVSFCDVWSGSALFANHPFWCLQLMG